MTRLLIVDDDEQVADLIEQVADALGFEISCVSRGDRILHTVWSFAPDLIVLDLMMPDIDGIEVLESLANESCTADIIIFSGAPPRVLNAAARLGASHGLQIRSILQKPVSVEDIEAALAKSAAIRWGDPKADLEAAISNGDLCVHYQPKVKIDGNACGPWAVTGIEALARWPHPSRGMVPPGEFVVLAEKTGLIGGLTDLVIEDAVQTAARLQRKGYALDVAINLSSIIAADRESPDRLAQLLEKNGLEKSQLVVEITESATAGDDKVLMGNLTRFRLKGMKLSLDDFGTGFSSLVQLYRMPFSELKIDKSFVEEIETNEEARIVVRSTVDLAHSLNLTVCAEGVETEEQFRFLRSVACDQAQGYFISKPLGESALERFLEENARPIKAAAVFPLQDGDRRSEMGECHRILVIEDEHKVRDFIMNVLDETGYEVVGAVNGREGIKLLDGQNIDLVVTDILMPGMEGIETIIEIRKSRPGIKIVAISGGGQTQGVFPLEMAEKFGADAILRKPFEPDDLLRVIRGVAEATQKGSGHPQED